MLPVLPVRPAAGAAFFTENAGVPRGVQGRPGERSTPARLDPRGDGRGAQINRYPYGMLYAVEADWLYIVAVMHLSRRPGYRHDRLG